MSRPRKDSGWVMVEPTLKNESPTKRLFADRKKTFETMRATIARGDLNILSMHVNRDEGTGTISELGLALTSPENILRLNDADASSQSTLKQWVAKFGVKTKMVNAGDWLRQSRRAGIFWGRGNEDTFDDGDSISGWLPEIVDFIQLASRHRHLILVGYDLRDTIKAMQDEWPSLVEHFSDAIDLWSVLHSATPTGVPTAGRIEALRALKLSDTFHTNPKTGRVHDADIMAVSNLAMLCEFYHLTTQQATELRLSSPQGCMVPRPYLEFSKTRGQIEGVYVAEIRTHILEAMPDCIDSTLKLADFITEHGYNPIKIGTCGRRWRWGECSSFRGIGITQNQREQGWACFTDPTALEIFVDEMNDMDIEGVRLDVRSVIDGYSA